MLRLITALALTAALVACDSSDTISTPEPPVDDAFSIAVVAMAPDGAPVEGLRVAIRPCFPVVIASQQDSCGASGGGGLVPTEEPTLSASAQISANDLGSVYPSPFIEQTTISYRSDGSATELEVEIVDLDGEVFTLVEQSGSPARDYTVRWENDGPSGVYTVRLQGDGAVIDSVTVAHWAVLPPDVADGPDVRGRTDAEGRLETQSQTLAPAFFGPGELEYRDEQNASFGTFTMPARIRITLIEALSGRQQIYDRDLVNGPNAFDLTWNG
ncbi:MAG: T9SS type A sorting domain-containing protein [Bacteroidota bacterium]